MLRFRLSAWALVSACAVLSQALGAGADPKLPDVIQVPDVLVPDGEPAATLRPLLERNLPAWGPTCIAVSPDGKTLATGSSDKTVTLWDLSNGKVRSQLSGHRDQVNSVAFSPDGKTLASGSDDKTVRLWDLGSGKERLRLIDRDGEVSQVAFSPDGKTLASASDTSIKLWDLDSGQERTRLSGLGGRLHSLAFSPNGKTLASSSIAAMKLWDLNSGKERAPLTGQEGMGGFGSSLAFSPDGKTLARGTWAGMVFLWELSTGKEKELARLGHDEGVESVAFSPDGKTLASASSDKIIRLWDMRVGKERARLSGHDGRVESMVFSPDGKTLISVGDGVRLWDLSSGKQRFRIGGYDRVVNSVVFSPDGKTLAGAHLDKNIRLWDLGSGKLQAMLSNPDGMIGSVAFSPDGKTLAGASFGNTVRLWDLGSRRELGTLKGHDKAVLSVAFNPKGTKLVSGSVDGTVRMWDLASRKELARLSGHEYSVNSVAFSPDGKTVASGSNDNSVRLWDADSGKLRWSSKGGDSVKSVAFSPNGNTLASGSSDKTVALWDVSTGKLQARLSGHDSDVEFVAFSPDGKTLASVSGSTVMLWDLGSGKQRRSLRSHGAWVYAVAFSPDGARLASASADGTTRLWNVHNGAREGILVSGRGGTWASCLSAKPVCWRADDGSLLETLDADGLPIGLRPPGEAQPLAVAHTRRSSTVLDPAEVQSIEVTVQNRGRDRAYWLQLVAAGPMQGWTMTPEVVPFLEPGQRITLGAQLHLWPERWNPQPRQLELPLAVAQAYGQPAKLPPLALTLQPSELTLKEVRLLRDRDQQALTVTLQNHGPALSRTAFQISAPGLTQAPEQILTALSANGEATVSFGLDSAFKVPRNLKITLTAQHLGAPDGRGFPLYDWEWRELPVALPGLPMVVYAAALLALAAVGAGVAYQRVYRHPMVLRLTSRPQALRELDAAELPEAKKVLSRARRLQSVLAAAGIPIPWFDAAARFDQLPDAQARAEALAKRLGCRIDRAVDEAGTRRWTLQLGEDFSLNLSRLRMELPEVQQVAQDVIQGLGRLAEVTLLVGARQEQRRTLAGLSAHSRMVVVPSCAELTALLLAEDPMRSLAQLIGRHAPVTQISPYQTGAGVQKAGLFFGRANLIAQVMGREPANYLVVGGRQLGKSSLLKEIARRYESDAGVDCHYMVLSDAQAPQRIATALGLAADSSLDTVLDHLRLRPDRRTLFLIDEADSFVEADRQNDFAILQRLRALSEEGLAHFILAGFWALYRQASDDYQSPLKNFGTVLQVGALEPEACKALATEPMSLLGITWESTKLVDGLVEETGQRANLVGLVCDEVISALGPRERVLGAAHLQAALASTRIRNALAGWSELGASEAECRLDRITVYASVKQGRFSLTELLAWLEAAGLSVQPEALRQSLSRLVLAFVVARNGQQFQYQVPLQRRLILDEDTDYLLRSEVRSVTP